LYSSYASNATKIAIFSHIVPLNKKYHTISVNVTDLIGFSELGQCLNSVDLLHIDRIVLCSSLKKQISLKNTELCQFSHQNLRACQVWPTKLFVLGILFAKEGKSNNNTAN